MDQYKEFCRLRDYRKPGAEVAQYTEAEAFALANEQLNCDDRSPTGMTYIYLLDKSDPRQLDLIQTLQAVEFGSAAAGSEP